MSGIATAVQRATDPVPGSVRRPAGSGRSATTTATAPEGAWRLSDTSAPESTVWSAFGNGTVADSAPVPLLHAPVVAPEPGASPLTRASLATSVPGGRVGSRPTVTGHTETSGAELSPPAAPAAVVPGGHGRMPATTSAAAAQPSFTAPASSSEAAVSSAGPFVSRSLDAARPNLGQSRRLRVGAAITRVSGVPLGLQRSTTARVADGAGAGSQLPGLPSPANRGATSTSGSAAGLPVARRLDGTAAAGKPADDGKPAEAGYGAAAIFEPSATSRGGLASPASAATYAGPVVPLRRLAVAGSTDAPLVGTLRPYSNPASPAVAIHLQSQADDEPAEEEGTPADALAALARIDQTVGIGKTGPAFGAPSALFPGAGSAAAGRVSTLPGHAGPSPTVARSMASPSAPSSGFASGMTARTSGAFSGRGISRGAALGASPMPAPAVQRTISWDPVTGMTTSADQIPAPGPAWSAPAASGAPAPTASSVFPALPAIAPLVARSFDTSESSSFAAVQREEAAAAAPAGEGGSGAAAPAAGGTMPEAQLDDLARRLHDKITARLSRDLLVERERAGSLIDRWW